MSNFENLNKSFNNTDTIDWGINTQGFEWVKASAIPEGSYTVHGVFMKKDKSGAGYGDTPCAIVPGAVVYLPQRYANYVEAIGNDPELVGKIKSGACLATFKPYTCKNGKNTILFEINEVR